MSKTFGYFNIISYICTRLWKIQPWLTTRTMEYYSLPYPSRETGKNKRGRGLPSRKQDSCMHMQSVYSEDSKQTTKKKKAINILYLTKLIKQMKKKIFTLLTLMLAVCSGAWGTTVTYALSTGDTFTSGQTVNVVNGTETVATITYGESGGDAFKAAKANTDVTGFTAFTEGNGTNGNTTGGTFYTIVPVYDGTITVGVVINKDKTFIVEENGTSIGSFSKETVKVYTTKEFSVSAGKSYKFYVSGSKLGFYGFIYEYTTVAATQCATPTYTLGAWDAENSKWTVTLNCGTAGATIKYSTDNKVSYSDYSTALALAPGTTLDAYAVKTGLDDSEAMAQYTVPAALSTFDITYANADGAEGIVPTALSDVEENSVITLPKNTTMFKEGYTLTGWNDGTTTYLPGGNYTVTANKTLTAVYTENTVTLAGRYTPVTVKWNFGQSNGMSAIQFEGTTGFVVTQATVNGSTIDVKLVIDCTSGKFKPQSNEWAQVNSGTVFTIPSANGAVITYNDYDNSGESPVIEVKQINVSVDGDTYVHTQEAAGHYYEYIKVVLPEPANVAVYNLTGSIGSAEKTADNATYNEGTSLVLSNTAGRIKITAAAGQTFKNGDIIVLEGTLGNSSKYFGIKYGPTTELGTNLYNGTAGETSVVGTLSLAADASELYIGRYDGTKTTVTSCKIYRLAQAVSTASGRNFATCVTPSGKLDFASADGITAYIATGFNTNKDAIVLQEVNIVPANTPIIVNTTTQGATVSVSATTADASSVTGNALVAGDGTTAWDGTTDYTYYYVASDQFHQATSGTLQSGKAYLKVLTSEVPSSARALGFVFADGESTGIKAVKTAEGNGEFFNLSGQRIAKPSKGLYIVNGKKVVVK